MWFHSDCHDKIMFFRIQLKHLQPEYLKDYTTIFTQMQHDSNLRWLPKKTRLPRANVRTYPNLRQSPKNKMSAKENYFTINFMHLIDKAGTVVAQWLRYCATNQKFTGLIPAGIIGFFIDIKSFRSHYGPGVDSASNRNDYQEYFLG